MSQRLIGLVPFSLALTNSTSSKNPQFTPIVEPLRAKMDISKNPVMKSFLAGSFSGTCSTILFQPLDLIKTRIQQAGVTTTASSSSTVISSRSSMFHVFRQVIKHEHFTTLWRGMVPSITRTVPGVGLYFSSLHWLKSHYNNADNPSPLQAIGLGMAARSFAGAIMIPFTVIKTRFESGAYNYARMSTAFTQIWKVEGVRGLTLGLTPTLFRDAPFSGLYLMFYTQLKQKVVPMIFDLNSSTTSTSKPPPPLAHFGCGILAGFAASAVTHPADVIKTKMQLRPDTYSSVRKTVVLILRSPIGVRGFTVGLAPRMLRRTLMSALAWTVYEEVMRQLGLK